MSAGAPIDILSTLDLTWRAWFRHPEAWRPWRVFLSVFFGLELDEEGLELFRQCTGRAAPPSGEFNEAWLICGRRAGKSFILALVAVYLAVFRSWRQYLSPGEVGTIKIVSVDRRQSRVIHRYAKALLTQVAALSTLVARDSDDEIELTNGITIEIQTASFRSIRGYCIIALLADEIAYWRNEETAANPDSEILASARPAMATLHGNAKLLVAGSPYARRGEQYRAYRNYFGRDDAPVLIWQAPTRTMNSTVGQSFIDAEIERDPEGAAAEYLAQFRDDLADYIDRAVVEAAVVTGRFELPREPGISYIGAIDTSGGAADSSVAAVSYADQVTGRAVLVALREHRAPFSPEAAAQEDAELFLRYGITRIVGDRYGGLWPVEAFARYGIAYEPADRTKSDFYRDLLSLLNSSKVELLDSVRLVNQLASLERRTGRGTGRDVIDHPPGAHDDCANAAAIALVLASIVAAPVLWHPEQLRRNGQAIAWPARCHLLYATAGVDQRGVFVAIWAGGVGQYLVPYADGLPRTLLIDFLLSPLGPTLFSELGARMAQIAADVEAAVGKPGLAIPYDGLIAPSELRSHAAVAGFRVGNADALLAPGLREALLLAASTEIGIGGVKLSTLAEQTGRHLPLPLGEIRPDSPRSGPGDAALLGVIGTLPGGMWPREMRTWSPFQ
jgi:hypothetical protein